VRAGDSATGSQTSVRALSSPKWRSSGISAVRHGQSAGGRSRRTVPLAHSDEAHLAIGSFEQGLVVLQANTVLEQQAYHLLGG
jgi:hypothetical protein